MERENKGLAYGISWHWLLTMVSTLSIGMVVGGVAKNTKTAGVIACILYFPILIFSGATIPFEAMPPVIQKIVSIFPLTQGMGLMKAVFLGLPDQNWWISATVMTVVTVVCRVVAATLFKWE